ncbi:MAG TPA: hypothetical protein VGE45_20090 [Chloroflexia bacterium]|jgi:hypothetical protein
MSDYSAILFAHPSFLSGLARALDIGGTLTEYNKSVSVHQADMLALRADWMAVGEDIRAALREIAKQQLETEARQKVHAQE